MVSNPNTTSEFIRVDIHASALQRIIRAQALHCCDLHCCSAQHKEQLKHLILQALSKEGD